MARAGSWAARRSFFTILPVSERGMASVISYQRGRLYGAMVARQWASRSSACAAPGCEHDDRLDRLSPLAVGHTDHGAVDDVGVAQQHGLDLDRVDVLAARLDHVLRPVDEVQEPVVVHAHDVAGVQPPVGEGNGGGVGQVPVAEHRARATQPELAFLARRQQPVVVTEDGDVEPEQGPADRARPDPLVVGAADGHEVAGLGRSVDAAEVRVGQHLGELVERRQRLHRRATEDDAHRRAVDLVRHRVDEGMLQAGKRDRRQGLITDEAPELLGVGARRDHDPRLRR